MSETLTVQTETSIETTESFEAPINDADTSAERPRKADHDIEALAHLTKAEIQALVVELELALTPKLAEHGAKRIMYAGQEMSVIEALTKIYPPQNRGAMILAGPEAVLAVIDGLVANEIQQPNNEEEKKPEAAQEDQPAVDEKKDDKKTKDEKPKDKASDNKSKPDRRQAESSASEPVVVEQPAPEPVVKKQTPVVAKIADSPRVIPPQDASSLPTPNPLAKLPINPFETTVEPNEEPTNSEPPEPLVPALAAEPLVSREEPQEPTVPAEILSEALPEDAEELIAEDVVQNLPSEEPTVAELEVEDSESEQIKAEDPVVAPSLEAVEADQSADLRVEEALEDATANEEPPVDEPELETPTSLEDFRIARAPEAEEPEEAVAPLTTRFEELEPEHAEVVDEILDSVVKLTAQPLSEADNPEEAQAEMEELLTHLFVALDVVPTPAEIEEAAKALCLLAEDTQIDKSEIIKLITKGKGTHEIINGLLPSSQDAQRGQLHTLGQYALNGFAQAA